MFASVVPAIRLPAGLPSFFDYAIPDGLVEVVQVGSVVAIPWRTKQVTGIVVGLSEHVGTTKSVKEIIGISEAVLPQWFLRALSVIAEDTIAPISLIAKTFVPEIPKRQILRDGATVPFAVAAVPSHLTSPLQQNLSHIPRLIITRSWEEKMEKVVEIVRGVLFSGRSVLILTPHHRDLSPIFSYVSNVFADVPITVVDPEASAGDRWRMFVRASSNTAARIILGTRSAVLVPDSTIGEIVVLEAESRDHRNFDGAPRYDARKVALVRGDGANVTYLSPAPRIEEFMVVEQTLESEPSPDQPIILDVSNPKFQLSNGVFPDFSLQEISDALEDGKRVFIFHNRKGGAAGLFCSTCRTLVRCPQCKNLLTPNNKGVRCSRCVFRSDFLPECQQCSGVMFGEFGIGTRKLAQELQKLFPEVAKIHVLDGDTDSLETVPNDTNIVIGTFLAAHDLTAIPSWFSPIGLVILTTVDALLAEADFRGSERAWQSVKGLTGFATAVRAVCIVHTVNPEHPFFGYLSRSASYFLTADVAQRQRLGYPPFGRLAVITRKKLPPQMKQGSLVDVAQVVRARFPEVTVWGPLFARGGERVILKAHVLAPALLAWLSTVSDQFSIDADPDIS